MDYVVCKFSVKFKKKMFGYTAGCAQIVTWQNTGIASSNHTNIQAFTVTERPTLANVYKNLVWYDPTSLHRNASSPLHLSSLL